MIAFTVTFMQGLFFFQLAGLYMQVVTQVILVGQLQPYQSKFFNRKEMVNELFILFCSYIITCFSDFVPD